MEMMRVTAMRLLCSLYWRDRWQPWKERGNHWGEPVEMLEKVKGLQKLLRNLNDWMKTVSTVYQRPPVFVNQMDQVVCVELLSALTLGGKVRHPYVAGTTHISILSMHKPPEFSHEGIFLKVDAISTVIRAALDPKRTYHLGSKERIWIWFWYKWFGSWRIKIVKWTWDAYSWWKSRRVWWRPL